MVADLMNVCRQMLGIFLDISANPMTPFSDTFVYVHPGQVISGYFWISLEISMLYILQDQIH